MEYFGHDAPNGVTAAVYCCEACGGAVHCPTGRLSYKKPSTLIEAPGANIQSGLILVK